MVGDPPPNLLRPGPVFGNASFVRPAGSSLNQRRRRRSFHFKSLHYDNRGSRIEEGRGDDLGVGGDGKEERLGHYI